jgi:hypothetical protein
MKLTWVSNENEGGSFLQIRGSAEIYYPLTQITKNREYFITKSKGDDKYTLTFVDDKVKKYLDTIEAAKQLAENNFINFYYK